MIHIVNPQTNEILDYITLDNIIEDTHKKSLESYIETYDAIVLGGDGFSYDKHLEKRNHIIIPDEDGTYQEFILFEVDKYRDTEGRKTHFYAHATYLELKKAKVIYPTRREGLTLSQHAGWALNDTGWTVGIVEAEGTRTFNIENHTNPYEFLKQIANEFDVELRFRIEHDGRRITARYVDFLERIGDWKGREVEFGRDLDGIRRIEKQDIVTALLGLGPEREDGTRLEVLVEDEEALQRWGRVDEHGNLHHLIEPYEIRSDRQEMTEEEAIQYTRTALNKRINTQVTYETTILDLEEVPGLEHEKIRFGDTIRIKDTYFNPPLYLEARVFEIERSIKNKAKKDIKLGDYIEYTEEEINAIWNQLRNEIRRRLDRMAIVTINSTAGNVFKNAQGETELTARTFVSGAERDEDGTLYDYQWMRFDKDGNHDTEFYAEGKTITVKASDIDEKATYRVLVAYELEVINTAEITISNVFDGEDGEPGPPGPKGDKGDKGDPGPQGPPGTSVVSIVEYYLATDQSSGVTIDTPGWTTTIQQMTPQKRYLWNYERINFSDGTYQNTNPAIIGVYGDEGEEGRSVVDITEYYLATNASSGVTRSTSGWTTTMQVTTPEKRYLWNYEEITWNKAPTKTYTEPVIIGVHGEKGEDGQGVENITIEYYVSDSDSAPIGGTWTETKPPYQKNKYLWTRNKITYKNPTEVEYATPILDDSWNAIAEAEEAKQEAEKAKITADGKNSLFTQSTQPSTIGRKIGDVWFDTSRDNLMHRFDGTEWVEAKWGEQSIVANSITANHIKSLVGLNVNDQFIVDSNGNVKFAGELEGASGTFTGILQGGTINGATFNSVDPNDSRNNTIIQNSNITSNGYLGGEYYKTIIDKGNIKILNGKSPSSLKEVFQVQYGGLTIGSVNEQAFVHIDPGLGIFFDGFPGGESSIPATASITGLPDYNENGQLVNKLQLGADEVHVIGKFISGNVYTDAIDSNPYSAGVHLYGRPTASGEFRVTKTGTTSTYRPIRASFAYVNAVDVNTGTHVYARPSSSGNLRVTSTGTTSDWRPVEAGGFENRSQEELKQDIELWTESALDIINQAKIYQYRLKTDVANGIDKLKYSVVIGEGYDTPEQFLSASGESVDVYVQTNINTKAIQELDSKFTNLEDKVNLLELENQYLKQKIQQLEAKLS